MPKKFNLIIPHPNLMILPKPVARNLLWREPNFGKFSHFTLKFSFGADSHHRRKFFFYDAFLVRKMAILKQKS
jgi:hypothetical protein